MALHLHQLWSFRNVSVWCSGRGQKHKKEMVKRGATQMMGETRNSQIWGRGLNVFPHRPAACCVWFSAILDERKPLWEKLGDLFALGCRRAEAKRVQKICEMQIKRTPLWSWGWGFRSWSALLSISCSSAGASMDGAHWWRLIYIRPRLPFRLPFHSAVCPQKATRWVY